MDMDGGVDGTCEWIATGVIHVNAIKMANFMLYMLYQDKQYF